MDPLYIRVHPDDNVAIVVNPEGLPAGTVFPSGLTLREAVPQSHKVALCDIPKGHAVRRYGAVIGIAVRDIASGSWVHEQVLEIPPAPGLEAAPLATAVPQPLPPLEGFTFEGYRNADGSVGTRNILGITTTVQCVAPTVEHAVRRIKQEVLSTLPGRGRRRGADAHVRVRCGDRLARGRRAGPHGPEPRPQPEPRRRDPRGQPRVREAAAGSVVPGRGTAARAAPTTSSGCRTSSTTASPPWWRPSCAPRSESSRRSRAGGA